MKTTGVDFALADRRGGGAAGLVGQRSDGTETVERQLRDQLTATLDANGTALGGVTIAA